ncbi:MAG: acyltransferase family protein [Candidatus Limnocylindrales bacterium]
MATSSDDGFRPDIEGLRGVAVGVVVLYHAALLGVVGGFIGVDVFFVISGFLITGLLLREAERRGGISFRHFYARRIRRLAPAGALVLILTLVATALLVDPLDRPDMLLDGAASALSIGNLRFAAAASDYFSAVSTPSPFLHFWSLAVEEQFYLVWPALLVAAVVLARGRHVRVAIGLVLASVFVTSFAANVWITDASVNWAFYSLPTRAWELAAGGLVAVAGTGPRRLPSWALIAAGTAGLAAIIASAFLLDGSVPYPGVAALVPTLGAVGVLLAAGRGPTRVLTLAPMRFLGRISYSLYLWHWPLLALPAIALGAALDPSQAAGLICCAVVAAYLSWRFVEMPFRRGFGGRPTWQPGRVLAGGLAALMVIALAAGGLAWQADQSLGVAAGPPDGLDSSLIAAPLLPGPSGLLETAPMAPDLPGGSTPPGPATLLPTTPSASGTAGGSTPSSPGSPTRIEPVSNGLPAGLHPTPAGARADTTEALLRADGCMGLDATSVPPDCVYGDAQGSFTVALVGDSHAAQWFTALDAIARSRGWRLETFTKVRCPFMDDRIQNVALKREYTECEAWDRAVVADLVAHPPDLTLISFDRDWVAPIDPAEATVPGEAASEARLVAKLPGRVGLIVDTPISNQDVPVCLASHTRDIRPCAFSRAIGDGNAIGQREAAVAASTGAGLIDLNALVCPGDPCQPIIDDILIFRDNSHFTATFSLALAPALARAIDAVSTGGP